MFGIYVGGGRRFNTQLILSRKLVRKTLQYKKDNKNGRRNHGMSMFTKKLDMLH